MANNIVILNRSESDGNVPKIIIRSKSDNKNSKVVEEIRNCLLQRREKFKVEISASEARKYTANHKELPVYLINRACSYKKPFVNNDFDYLRRSVRTIGCTMAITLRKIVLSYEIKYLTTLAQEKEIDLKLKTIFSENNIFQMRNPIDRIRFIYDYISKNVRYDRSLVRHSAYDALIDNTAVCEGCALLLYRMLSMASVPCRIITGKGHSESHAWNIVKLNGLWYNADITWDLRETYIERHFSIYKYFLKSNTKFPDHIRDAEFSTPLFMSEHPMSTESFQSTLSSMLSFGT